MMSRPHHPTRAHADRKPRPPVPAPIRRIFTREELEVRFGRMTVHESWEAIRQQHHGNPPALVCWQGLADKREAVRCGTI